jgi:dTDP-4-amino-4,6-dideoxygalactose transaminase
MSLPEPPPGPGLGAGPAARRRVNAGYAEALGSVPGVEMLPQAAYGESNCWLTCVLLDPDEFGATPEQVCHQLAAHDIEARPTWKPMHLQPVFRDAPRVGGAVSEAIFARSVCLPSGSALTASQQLRVIEALLATPRALTAVGA